MKSVSQGICSVHILEAKVALYGDGQLGQSARNIFSRAFLVCVGWHHERYDNPVVGEERGSVIVYSLRLVFFFRTEGYLSHLLQVKTQFLIVFVIF